MKLILFGSVRNAEALSCGRLQKWPVCARNVPISSMAVRTAGMCLCRENAENVCGTAAAVPTFFHYLKIYEATIIPLASGKRRYYNKYTYYKEVNFHEMSEMSCRDSR